MNTYAYALGNPLRYVDPSGLVNLNLIPGYDEVQRSGANNTNDPNMFTVAAHGSARNVKYRNNNITAKDLADMITDHPDFEKGMPVKIYACDTGSTEDGLAQQLADELQSSTVTAPDNFGFFSAKGFIGVYAPMPHNTNLPDISRPGNWASFSSRN